MEHNGDKGRWQVDVEQLRKGDKKCFERLFKEHYAPLTDYAYRILHDRAEAQDVVQDVFCKLWDGRESLDIRHSLSAYLYKMAYTNCMASLRHQKVVQEYAEQEALDLYFKEVIQTPEAELNLINKDLRYYIDEAVEKLPPRCREIFILAQMEQKSHQEIAGQLGVSVKTVENQLGIAMTKLRKDLEWLLLFMMFFKSI